ncbi:MAG: c-type cytochrome [Phycisphaerales bacterium]|nr:c-type cytochrome [Phycisphaerales bacterium]
MRCISGSFRRRALLNWVTLVVTLMSAAPVPAVDPPVRPEFAPAEIKRILEFSQLGAVPPDPTNRVADSLEAAQFGQRLFFSRWLASDMNTSCATCHMPERYFTDGDRVGRGVGVGTRNTPTLINSAYQRWQFWDGRSDTLWSQALHPIETPHEMNGSRVSAVLMVASDERLRADYERVFGALPDLSSAVRFPRGARPGADAGEAAKTAWHGMAEQDRESVNQIFSHLGKALAAYERKLVGRGAAFDRFVDGLREGNPEKQQAISAAAIRGLRLFIGEAGCRNCHFGSRFSSGEFHDTSVPPADGGVPRDAGRFDGVRKLRDDPFNAAGRFSDDPKGALAERTMAASAPPESWGQFKVPSLRNVAKTAPYMHEGQFATLRDVVRFYSTRENAVPAGHHPQETILRPLRLTNEQIDDLVAFLETLTDQQIADPQWLKPPD